MRYRVLILLLVISIVRVIAQKQKANPNKTSVIQSVDKHEKELIDLSDKIWSYAETALKEHKSSKVLADYAASQGFVCKARGSRNANGFCGRIWIGKTNHRHHG